MTYSEFINIIKTYTSNVKIEGVYMERHHILPRCMGGKDIPSNLLYLTLPDHIIAHKLLAEENPTNRKLQYAYSRMSISRAKYRKLDPKYKHQLWSRATGKYVICLDTGKISTSIKRMAEELGNCTDKGISAVCCKTQKTHRGLHFALYNPKIHTDKYIRKWQKEHNIHVSKFTKSSNKYK